MITIFHRIIHMKQECYQKHKKGFALTEVLLAIAVIVIVGITAYPLYKSSRQTADIEGLMNVISSLRKNVDENYNVLKNTEAQQSGQNFDQVLFNLGLIPDGITIGTAGPTFGFLNYKEYGIGVNVGGGWYGQNTQNPEAFVYMITENNEASGSSGLLTQKQCAQIMAGMYPQFDNLVVNSTTLKKNGKVIITLPDAPSYCPTSGVTEIQGSDSAFL